MTEDLNRKLKKIKSEIKDLSNSIDQKEKELCYIENIIRNNEIVFVNNILDFLNHLTSNSFSLKSNNSSGFYFYYNLSNKQINNKLKITEDQISIDRIHYEDGEDKEINITKYYCQSDFEIISLYDLIKNTDLLTSVQLNFTKNKNLTRILKSIHVYLNFDLFSFEYFGYSKMYSDDTYFIKGSSFKFNDIFFNSEEFGISSKFIHLIYKLINKDDSETKSYFDNSMLILPESTKSVYNLVKRIDKDYEYDYIIISNSPLKIPPVFEKISLLK